MRITPILNVIALLFSSYITIINAAPASEKRQEQPQDPDFNTNIFTAFKALDPTATPQTRQYTLKLSRADLAPDGFTRSVWTANGQYPGPLIRANKGDRLVISVQNNLNDLCSIHWHGIFQKGTTYYDGVAGQTQCLIPDKTTFVYNFTAGDQYGTYWWHSHYIAQYVDGLRGPLVIHDPKDPNLKDYDEEFVMTLSDWHHAEAEALVKLRTAANYGGFNPIPDSGLISGRGRYDCSKAPSGSKCTPNNPLAVYMVEKGKRYRFRIINTSAEAPYTFSIDNHPLRVIEVEGENIKPISLNKMNIAVGQRYSVIVTADQNVGNFWIRATIVQACMHTNERTINRDSAINYKVTGILRYQGASNDDPTSQEWDEQIIDCRDVDHNLLKLDPPKPPPTKVTDTFTLNINFVVDGDGFEHAVVNGEPFTPELEDPTANRLMQGGDLSSPSQLDKDQNAFVYDTDGGAVEIVLINNNSATHPFHLHGHNFFIMGHGEGTTPDTSQYNLVDPAVRDTVTVLGYSWTTIRYNIDNPGIWAFHCHIEWHVELGMVGQLIERPSLLKNDPIPPEVKAICPKTESQKRAVREFAKRHYRNSKNGMRIRMVRGSVY